MPDLEEAAKWLTEFCDGQALTEKIAQLEAGVSRRHAGDVQQLLNGEGICRELLDSAFLIKSVAGQINVVIHAVASLVSLPHILEEGETIEYASLGAGSTGREFDLETDRRVAEFKFIQWQGGTEPIRQNQLFKDFFNLAEHQSDKRRCLYVLGAERPISFLSGNRTLDSVLSRNEGTRRAFFGKYGDRYKVVSDYYRDAKHLVEIIDLTEIVPELGHLRPSRSNKMSSSDGNRDHGKPVEGALGMHTASPPYTLHEAMVKVLKECPDFTAEQVYLHKTIRHRKWYWQMDGTELKLNQIAPTAKNYPRLFEKIPANRPAGRKARIRLRPGAR